MNLTKTSLSLPPEMVDDLGYLAKRMGFSRSAILTNLAREPISDLRKLVSSLPENPTKADILRSRGASKKVITKRLDELKKLEAGDDLFA
jgi:predicted DNA-binding protein